MKNVNVYVDVGLTLVDHVGVLLPDAVEAIRILYDAGCHLFRGPPAADDIAEK